MTARKNRRSTPAEDYHEYHLHEQIERGEKVVGEQADWLDRRGTAARIGRRADAERRHEKPRGPHRW